MNRFVLYGTSGCHLCDEAELLLTPLLSADSSAAGACSIPSNCSIECIDIAESDQLIERYGTAIPVLRRLRDDAELHWPFDAAQAQRFLAGR